jgi:serine/tyrosine/threonine adenylyltransferase
MQAPATAAATFPFDNSYARLPEGFHVRLDPTPVQAPKLVRLNRPLAAELGLELDGLNDDEIAAIFAGNRLPDGAEPLAMAYAGHQFGGFVPQLGDGRAILLGEVVDNTGTRRDIQLKGAGRTPFSRGGDGRAALGPVLREYLISEAMHALGIPTTRALAAVTTGERVYREDVLPGAVITRVAQSHVRVGTFQFFAARGDTAATKRLADYVIDRHYPELKGAANPYQALLRAVLDRQAALVTRWLMVGFIHGVMNTDNTSIIGETIDFGPCAFMDSFDPLTWFSSVDEYGRYAFARQPAIAQWNLARLAEAMLPLLDDDTETAIAEANAIIEAFEPTFSAHWQDGMRKKLGLATAEDTDRTLIGELLDAMHQGRADFTLTFRALADALEDEAQTPRLRALFSDPAAFDTWHQTWRHRLERESTASAERVRTMRQVSPAIIPRNHQVEKVLDAAIARADYQPFERLHAALAHPYDDTPETAAYAAPPEPTDIPYRTFCGT